jgi:hypothetical protein
MVERVQGGYTDHLFAVGQRKALHGRDADSQPRKRAGAGSHRKQIDVSDVQLMSSEKMREIPGQPLSVRHCGIASTGVDNRAVARQRDTALSSCGVECQH